jgi:hypothetical protein
MTIGQSYLIISCLRDLKVTLPFYTFLPRFNKERRYTHKVTLRRFHLIIVGVLQQ